MTNIQIMQKFDVHLLGDGEQTLVIGHGQADISDTNPHHYHSIESYCDDVLNNMIFIRHSAQLTGGVECQRPSVRFAIQ